MNVISSPLHILQRARTIVGVTTIERALYGTLARQRGLSPQDFDVDPHTGFFPPQPLPKLPEAFSKWEEALVEAQEVICLAENQNEEAIDKRPAGELWRNAIRAWPVLDTAVLKDNIRYLQKAHMVLSFILHFYAHSVPKTSKDAPISIPKSITIPLVAISQELGIAPVMTFADTVLWNWELVRPDEPLSIANIRYVNLLSGSETEREFYTSSAAVELKGVEMLQIIESFMNLPNVTDNASVTKINRDLVQLRKIVEDLTEIFQSVRGTVDPTEFYWLCRPWYVGSKMKNSQPSWIFEGVPNYAKLDLSGPSAGQSTVMHALDVFLDIDHKLAQRRQPGKHREYLVRVGSAPCTVREVARVTPTLQEPYNRVVAALKRLRDEHIKIACLYVVTKINSTPSPQSGIVPEEREDGPSLGTGGSHITSLLKAGRDATHRAALLNA